MFEIFGHRAIFNGIENSVNSLSYYKKLGVGIELDLRLGKNGVYVSHDPTNNGDLFEKVCEVCTKLNIKMALHIKENNIVQNVIELLKKYSINNYFLFNTENFNFSKIENDIEIASYVNKKPENIYEKIFWCDEIQSKWYSKEIFSKVHKNNKIIYGMSLEVVQTCNEKEIISEWKRLIGLGIDGICTKYPEKLLEYVKGDLN